MSPKKFLKDNIKNIIIYLILWILIAIVFVMPITYCTAAAIINGPFDFEKFLELIPKAFAHPFKSFSAIIAAKMIGKYITNLVLTTIIYVICFMIGAFKYKEKSDYADIEHGSSDWSQNGEQYKVLNNKEGIILAEGNYLPVDKVGNVNVLVVGRIRFW